MAVSSALLLSTSAFSFNGIEDNGVDDWKVSEQGNGGALMFLEMIPESVAAGAVCMDGTPTGFYYQPAYDEENANNWQFYFQGGGWCYDERDCWKRSKTTLGSSTHWFTNTSMGGLMSGDCQMNPDFCNYNKIQVPYCDGNSFSSNRDEPVEYEGDKLYFRGRRILDIVMETIDKKYNLRAAKKVLLTGCSAGGLTAYLHTNYFGDWFTANAKGLEVFKSAPMSGMFLEHNNIEGKSVYPDQMKNIFELTNATYGLDPDCIKGMPGQEWKCNFAQHSYRFTRYPVMVLNSALDAWQMPCIYAAEYPTGFPNQTGLENGNCSAVPTYKNCAANPESCTSDQIIVMNQYITDFEEVLTVEANETYNKPGNGAFIHSCHTHCEALHNRSWPVITVDDMTIRLATIKWWESPLSTPASDNHYTPCHYNVNGTKKRCNPTCTN